MNFAQKAVRQDFTGGNFAGTFTDNGNAAALQFGNVGGNVNVSGNLSTFTANAVSGTIYSAGALGTATVGSLTGKIVAASQITSLSATSMTGCNRSRRRVEPSAPTASLVVPARRRTPLAPGQSTSSPFPARSVRHSSEPA